MVHIPVKFWENTSMRFRVTVRKLNLTNGPTHRQMDGRGGGGVEFFLSRPRAYDAAGDKYGSKPKRIFLSYRENDEVFADEAA